MVVTRRAPVVPPPPPASRTQSSQGTRQPLRASAARDVPNTQTSSNSRDAEGAKVEGLNDWKERGDGNNNSPGKKSKKHRKSGKNRNRNNFQAFLDFLTKLLLLAFTIYTLSVCPQDTHLQSPVCRGLSEYKRIVLDPYVIPPIQATIAHPSIAPHIERTKPYVDRAIEITTPILLRTQQQWNLHVVPQWENRIVPEWNKRIVPQWNKYVVPKWNAHVVPYTEKIQAKVEPYRLLVEHEYEHRFAPHARRAIYNLQLWQHQAQPYLFLAASKTRDGYNAVRPYAVPLIKQVGLALQRFALFLQVQRQKFVDPHVATIWEKVKELSRGKPVLHEPTAEPEASPLETISVVGTSDDGPIFLSTSSFAPVHETTPEELEHSRDQTLATPTQTFTPAVTVDERTPIPEKPASPPPTQLTTPEVTPAPPTQSESIPSPEPVTADSLHQVDPTPSSSNTMTEELHDSLSAASSSVEPVVVPPAAQTLESAFSVIIETASAAAPDTPATSSTAGSFTDEIDIEAFYAELGINEPLINSSGTEQYVPSQPTETEEDKAERLRLKAEETARKRADIEARHAKWEAELQAQMERSTTQLQSHLQVIREAAAADLASSIEVRASIEDLVTEAEKYIRGAEIYLRNLKGENRKSDEKFPLWDRVVQKVGDKFNEHLLVTDGVINAWYGLVLDQELQEVASVSAAVRDVAEKGQVDLGLDYAWLEDVTYADWQRYHALIGTSENYAHEAASIQNSTHPTASVANPLIPILDDLELEVQDVVIGFETRLRRIKRDGERAFNNNGAAQKEEEKGTPVEPEIEPRVSILPIDREERAEFVPPVVIGRSKEEVLEALGRVQPQDDEKPSSDDSNVEPEEKVSSLVREAEGEASIHSASVDIPHTAL
ncbi:hypothetical protein F5I97DRAFT_1829736 [Phlebopus sp. FC_14]|nr:hypothetical protein F5I97DRAFT_1829736 [Phlebopus sp. FC_14]